MIYDYVFGPSLEPDDHLEVWILKGIVYMLWVPEQNMNPSLSENCISAG